MIKFVPIFFLKNEIQSMERACRIGSEDVFSCKYYSKAGYSQCKVQAKVVFPGHNSSVQFFMSNDSHTHVRSGGNNRNDKSTKFS